MSPDVDHAPDIPYEFISEYHLLYDLVYNPETTLFMKKGMDKGATVINGLAMLHGQAEKAWEIWNV
jgi:shikimate dehydrogenase